MSRNIAPPEVIAAAMRSRSRYDLIAVASSAGGLAALIRILPGLPADLPAPLIIVQHRGARHPEMLPKILRRSSALPVKLAEQGELLKAGTIYVAPADYHLVVRPDRTLQLTDGKRIKHVLSSANPLFESAAEVLKNRVIGVVLTGSGSDATDGVQAIKARGGVVIAQNPEEAEHPGMPASAIRSGAVDYVVPLAEIPQLLTRLASTNGNAAPATANG